MAKYDHGGGCPCGLYKTCECKDAPLSVPKEDQIKALTARVWKLEQENKRYQRLAGTLFDALVEYGNPEFYHAVTIVADQPAGSFADDLDDNHAHPDYNRPMPGKLARETIGIVYGVYGDMTISSALPDRVWNDDKAEATEA